jgi:hypothetical protein
LVLWSEPKAKALSELDAVQPTALFSSKQSFVLRERLVSVAALAISAALVDSAVIVHMDPCFGHSVGSQAASSVKGQMVAPLDALAVEDVAREDMTFRVAEV